MKDEHLLKLLNDVQDTASDETSCPDEYELTEITISGSNADVDDSVLLHVQRCPACRQTLESMRASLVMFEEREPELKRGWQDHAETVKVNLNTLASEGMDALDRLIANVAAAVGELVNSFTAPALQSALATRSTGESVEAHVTGNDGVDDRPGVFAVEENLVSPGGRIVLYCRTQDLRFIGQKPSGYHARIEVQAGNYEITLGESAIFANGKIEVIAELGTGIPLNSGRGEVPVDAIKITVFKP